MALTRFACAYCNLAGPVPFWGANTCLAPGGLQYFDISHNAFSGKPPELCATSIHACQCANHEQSSNSVVDYNHPTTLSALPGWGRVDCVAVARVLPLT